MVYPLLPCARVRYTFTPFCECTSCEYGTGCRLPKRVLPLGGLGALVSGCTCSLATLSVVSHVGCCPLLGRFPLLAEGACLVCATSIRLGSWGLVFLLTGGVTPGVPCTSGRLVEWVWGYLGGSTLFGRTRVVGVRWGWIPQVGRVFSLFGVLSLLLGSAFI